MEKQPYTLKELMAVAAKSEDVGLGIAIDMWDQVRGMNRLRAGYSKDDVRRLRMRLERAGVDPDRVGSYKGS